MTGYTVGYGKTPLHSRFRPGNNMNPLGRGARRKLKKGDILWKVLNALETVTENDKKRQIPRIELLVKRYGNAALKGDVEAAAMLLELHQHFATRRDTKPRIRLVRRILLDSPSLAGGDQMDKRANGDLGQAGGVANRVYSTEGRR